MHVHTRPVSIASPAAVTIVVPVAVHHRLLRPVPSLAAVHKSVATAVAEAAEGAVQSVPAPVQCTVVVVPLWFVVVVAFELVVSVVESGGRRVRAERTDLYALQQPVRHQTPD